MPAFLRLGSGPRMPRASCRLITRWAGEIGADLFGSSGVSLVKWNIVSGTDEAVRPDPTVRSHPSSRSTWSFTSAFIGYRIRARIPPRSARPVRGVRHRRLSSGSRNASVLPVPVPAETTTAGWSVPSRTAGDWPSSPPRAASTASA